MDDRELEDQFLDELTALERSGATLPLVLQPTGAFHLLSVLQLALAHPDINAFTRAGAAHFAQELARNIEGRLCKAPAMAEVARRGWLPRDEPAVLAVERPELPELEPEPPARPARPVQPPIGRKRIK